MMNSTAILAQFKKNASEFSTFDRLFTQKLFVDVS